MQNAVSRKGSKRGLVATALLLAACSEAEAEVGGQPSPSTKSGVTRLTSSAARARADGAEAISAARSEQAVAFKLLHALPAHENQAFSPRGLSNTFAKLTDAAADETLEQIQQAFAFEGEGESFHRAQNALAAELASRDLEAETDARGALDAVVLAEASDLWLSQQAPPQSSFLDTLARYYGTGVYHADFRGRANDVRQAINRRISDQTHGLIPNLLPEKSVTPETVFVLTSALYFKAPWATPFLTASPGAFHLLDGTSRDVPMLRRTASLPYFEGESFASVSIPYRGDQLSLLLIVPEEGAYDPVRDAFTGEELRRVVDGLAATTVELAFPKFSFGSDMEAQKILQSLGVTAAFAREGASFPKLRSETGEPVHLSAVLQRTTVSVDERGTEAAAATAVVGASGGSAGPPPEPRELTVDRPFLFVIRDQRNGSPLFVGQVVSP